MEKKILSLVVCASFILGLLIGYIVGYPIGNEAGLNWCVDKGIKFLNLKGIDIEVNTQMLTDSAKHYLSNFVDIPKINWSGENAPLPNN